MEIFVIIAVGIAAVLLVMLICSSARFEDSKSMEFRRQEAERERRWLDYQCGGHYSSHHHRHGR